MTFIEFAKITHPWIITNTVFRGIQFLRSVTVLLRSIGHGYGKWRCHMGYRLKLELRVRSIVQTFKHLNSPEKKSVDLKIDVREDYLTDEILEKVQLHEVSELELEVFKPAPVHCCTDFTSTAIATVSTYGRDIRRIGTLLQAVRVVQDLHPLNTHPYPQPTRTTLPDRHPFAGINLSYSREQREFSFCIIIVSLRLIMKSSSVITTLMARESSGNNDVYQSAA
ncbi:hypothetical protein RF11_12912 [Thelohanellus kitauei]|uniref:Uncharacterized protein n=1 Tax=Thelohanellus kitauei TaxID=669202 RepID=A0A0C2MIM3_THEKT|nr:hypothetical protein RF11_12912 [Thelohanellus kitauei]